MSLLDQQSDSGYVVCCGAVWHESSLLRAAATYDGWERAGEQYPGEQFAWDGEEGDAPVVAADKPITLTFPEWQDDPSGPVCGELLCLPSLVEDVGKPLDDVIAP